MRKKIGKIIHGMSVSLITFGVLCVLVVGGIVLIRDTLLRNAHETGTALAQNFATEESGDLAVYETLLSFAASSLDYEIEKGSSEGELRAWADLYFRRVDAVLEDSEVDPYVVKDGQLLAAAEPWDTQSGFDPTQTVWYQRAVESPGQVIFTGVYTDAINNYPVITAAQKCMNNDVVVAFDILPENITFSYSGLQPTSSFYLCDGTGTIIYQQSALDLDQQTLQNYLNGILAQIQSGQAEDYQFHIRDEDGERRAVYYARMDNGWYSVVTVSYNTILGALDWFGPLSALLILVALVTRVWMVCRGIRLDEKIQRTDETVKVLGNTYYALYRVNYVRETYEAIKSAPDIASRLPEQGDYRQMMDMMGQVIDPETYEQFRRSFSVDNIRQLVAQRVRDFGGDFLRRFPDGTRWVNMRVLFDDSLDPEEVVLCFREVEEEKLRQLQQKRLLEDALEVSRKTQDARQSFFNSMSHDMRTPLSAIIGMTELARRQQDQPERVEQCLAQIESSSQQLLRLINDILDMSRIEQGKLMLDYSQFDLEECIEQCAGPFRLQAEGEGKQLTVDTHIQDKLLLGDAFRIQQVLGNLLSNAMKFTDPGGNIHLQVTQLDRGEVAPYRFVVSDTGRGISEDFLPHLFEPYSREVRFSARRTDGTGLGMAIMRNLVNQMNGEIQVDSMLGKGTTFTVTIPLVRVYSEPGTLDEPDHGADPAEALAGRRVLLAEDNEINMEIAAQMLESKGVQVTRAWNGAQAVEAFSSATPFAFDAILMDMQMPEVDGCEAARRIRAMDRPDAGRVPILALTANAFSADLAATAAAGMNAHITKPIDFPHLFQILSDWISRSGATD